MADQTFPKLGLGSAPWGGTHELCSNPKSTPSQQVGAKALRRLYADFRPLAKKIAWRTISGDQLK